MPLKHSIKEVSLKNGSKGLVIDVPEASVFSYDLNFRAGNSFVKNPSIQQAAHILEHLAFNGTKNYPSAEEFSQVFTENGAHNNAITYENGITYFGGSADFEAERIIDLQIQALTEPMLDSSSLEREKRTVNEELTAQLSNYPRLLWSSVNKAMGAEAFTDQEKIKTIKNVTVGDIREHYQRTHTTNNLRFILAGNLRGKRLGEMLGMIENMALPVGKDLSIKKIKMNKADQPILIKNNDIKNVYFTFVMGLQRQLSIRELYAMRILNHITTSTFHSRIFGQARKLGLAYYLHSGVNSSSNGVTDFRFSTEVTKDNRLELYDLLISELKKISINSVTAKELEAAKKFSYGEYQQFGQTIGALSSYYASFFDDLPIIPMEDVADIINSINTNEIKDLLNEFLSSEVWGVGELGDISKKTSQETYDTFSNQLFSKKEVKK